MGSMEFDWGRLIVGQLEFYWDVHLRPRLDGLTDEEYLWEPVKDAWNLRRRPDGGYDIDDGPPPGRHVRRGRPRRPAAGQEQTAGDHDRVADDAPRRRLLLAQVPGVLR